MVSVNPNAIESQGIYLEEWKKKERKPYTITKSREIWTPLEHDKFLEALRLFDRDWKKIEAFVGSKTVVQIRSHAQKYFLKVQKSGSNERVPPPRRKRKAAYPYPQKASKTAPVVSRATTNYQMPSAVLEPVYLYPANPSSVLVNPVPSVPTLSGMYGSVPALSPSNTRKDDGALAVPSMAPHGCSSSSNVSDISTWATTRASDQGNQAKSPKVMPDFAQVYSFIGSVFDPNVSDHLQRLKNMDPINVETALLLMRNLSVNLMSPEFEEHRRFLSQYDVDSGKVRSCSPRLPTSGSSNTAIPAV